MKSQIISRIAGCFLLVLFMNSSFAQANLKMLYPVALTGVNLKVGEKIENEFRKHFTNAENVKWYYIDKKFVAKFSMNAEDHQVLLNKKGMLIYDILYGSEKNLPLDLRKEIKINYFDYNIAHVFKINQSNKTTWVVNLEDSKSIVILRVQNGEMEELNNFQKSL